MVDHALNGFEPFESLDDLRLIDDERLNIGE